MDDHDNVVNADGGGGEEGDDDGHEKIMWESDGLGEKFMPISLASMANLYVSVTNSLVGMKRSNGVFWCLLVVDFLCL